jgi:hypothetical protein
MQENTIGINTPISISRKNIDPFRDKSTELLSNKLWLPNAYANLNIKKTLACTNKTKNRWFSFSGVRTNTLPQQNNPLHGTLIERIASFINKSEHTSAQIKTKEKNSNMYTDSSLS